MKIYRKVVAGVLTSILAVSGMAFNVMADIPDAIIKDKCGDNITCKQVDTTNDGFKDTLILSGTGDMYNYEVGSVPYWENSQFENVIIEDGITSIGDYFFASCYIQNITIPNSVTRIGRYAFDYCQRLESVELPDSVVEIDENAFRGCKGLTSVKLPSKLTEIGDCIFNDCISLENITIPKTVTSIGPNAFVGCEALSSIDIPDKVTSIGYFAFAGCSSLESIKLPSSLKVISSALFKDCSNLKSIDIPNTVTEIEAYAFMNCTSLDSITLPKSLEKMQEYIFYGCTSLTDLYIPDSVKTVGIKCVEECTGLKKISVPCILQAAFSENKDILEVRHNYISGTTNCAWSKCGDNVFYDSIDADNDGKFETLAITGKGKVDDFSYENMVPWGYSREDIKKVTIEDGVTNIGDNMFSGLTNLEEISIPDSVTQIGDSALAYCYNLAEVNIPKNVTSIGDSAFSNCESLKSIILPEAITSIGSYAFAGCKTITEIDIPDSVTSIGGYAFDSCEALTRVKLPASLESIGSLAFYQCRSLETVTIPDNVQYVGDAFALASLKTINAPCSLQESLNAQYNNDYCKVDIEIRHVYAENSTRCVYCGEGGAGDVSTFAERLYTTCLGRESEGDGKDYWSSVLKSGMTGAEVAEGFFFSPEFEQKQLSDEEYIGSLYETFMGRTPAEEEVAYWASEMKGGLDRKAVFDGFVNSTEWADICLDYGIKSGGLGKPSYEKKASQKVTSFAERLYTTCLGRESEEEGLKYWSQELANLRNSGVEAARGFFFSQEFLDQNLSDQEFVTRLYRTFMGREPDIDGYFYWVGLLIDGASREEVFNGFAGAPEFVDICVDAGIFR